MKETTTNLPFGMLSKENKIFLPTKDTKITERAIFASAVSVSFVVKFKSEEAA